MRKMMAVLSLLLLAAPAGALDLTGRIGLELRGFFQDPLDPAQQGSSASLVLAPELYQDFGGGGHALILSPYLRLDSGDDERSHFDLREAYWQTYGSAWEFNLGLRRVFWGVTESAHLVDVLNQTDGVENPDGEDKLGQPMINLGIFRDWGDLELFILPGHRDRGGPGAEGRLRPAVILGDALYDSAEEERHVDWALRWSRPLGIWDLGLSHFSGTSREPRYLFEMNESGKARLVPLYELIEQTGLELQATTGGWLWKFEGIHRSGQGDDFAALATGFEYTLVGLFGTIMDLGIVGEYLHDDRKGGTLLDEDIFVGGRFVLNDVQSSEALAGAIIDLETGASLLSVELARRLGDRWRLEAELRAFVGEEEDPFLAAFTRDDYLQIELQRFF